MEVGDEIGDEIGGGIGGGGWWHNCMGCTFRY